MTSTNLHSELDRLKQPMTYILALIAAASGYYTFLGVRSLLGQTTVEYTIAAAVFSVAVSAGIWAFWVYYTRVFPLATKRQRNRMALGLVFGPLFIVGMSSYFNVIALGGNEALERHMAVSAEEYNERLDRAYRSLKAEEQLLTALALARNQFVDLAAGELTGTFSGFAGRGAIVQTFEQLAARISDLEQQVTESQAEVERLYDEGNERLSNLRQIFSREAPTEERAIEFGREANRLNAIIAQMQQRSAAGALGQIVANLENQVVTPAIGGGQLGVAQQQVLDNSNAVIADVSRRLKETISDLSIIEISTEPFRTMSASRAVVVYASYIVPHWTGAIAIDIFPIVIVAFLTVAYGRQEAEVGDREQLRRDMTVEQLETAEETLRRLRVTESAVAKAEDLPELIPIRPESRSETSA